MSAFLVMGVVNVTPDSFSDGGRYLDATKAIAHGRALLDEGADLIDVGGESTRPGAEPVSAEEEKPERERKRLPKPTPRPFPLPGASMKPPPPEPSQS